MKTFATIMKIVAALAAIAGIVYVAIKYGDKIVAWVKNVLHLDCCCCDDCNGECCCEGECEDCEAAEADFEG